MPPLLVTLEGVDGAGSTTQTKLLSDFLKRNGHQCLATKEPTDGRVGRVIRENLRSAISNAALDALLFAADRIDHLETIVKPALSLGEHVICDRYVESTFAYQSAQGLDLDWLLELNKFALNPHIVIILDADPEITLARKHLSAPERFETVEFLQTVRQNFKKRAEAQRFNIVNAEQPVDQVHDAIKGIVLRHLEAMK